uniref:Uncharacterized protein n=1 Tax=Rhizophora mucronata TaxID=61149 RepID=A0A2P2NGB4_RHIMU
MTKGDLRGRPQLNLGLRVSYYCCCCCAPTFSLTRKHIPLCSNKTRRQYFSKHI